MIRVLFSVCVRACVRVCRRARLNVFLPFVQLGFLLPSNQVSATAEGSLDKHGRDVRRMRLRRYSKASVKSPLLLWKKKKKKKLVCPPQITKGNASIWH